MGALAAVSTRSGAGLADGGDTATNINEPLSPERLGTFLQKPLLG